MGVFFQIMPPCRQYIFNISFAIVEIKKCANLQQIRSERDICTYVRTTYAMRHGILLSAMDSSALNSSAMDSSAMDSSAMDSSAMDSSAREAALDFAKEEKEIGTVALVRVLNKGRLDSLGAEKEIGTFALGKVLNKGRRDSLSADLRIEKEQGRVADRRLRRKGKLD